MDHQSDHAPSEPHEQLDKLPTFNEPDLLLQALAHLADTGMELSITLTCGGILLSGEMIGRATYYEELRAEIANVGKGEGVELITTVLEGLKPDETTPPDLSKMDRKTYVHLRKAKYLDASGGYSSVGTGLWRGRLAMVTGFAFGRF